MLPHAIDVNHAKQLWELSCELCNIENNNQEIGKEEEEKFSN